MRCRVLWQSAALTGSTESIAAAGATHTQHQFTAPQLGKQLLQVGQGNVLPPGNIGQANRTIVSMYSDASTSLPLDDVAGLLDEVAAIDRTVKRR